jgi:hypothetical protein
MHVHEELRIMERVNAELVLLLAAPVLRVGAMNQTVYQELSIIINQDLVIVLLALS